MRIVTQVWRNQPGRYFCISTKSVSGTWRDHFFSRKEFKNVIPFVEANTEKNLYWCPHGFRSKSRTKDQAVMPKALWADLDEANPEEIPLRPSIAWESSPGRFAAIWLLDEEIESDVINKNVTYAIGADRGGWDLTQVLRIPGTKNYKYKSQPKGKLLWADGPSHKLSVLRRKYGKEGEASEPNLNITEIWKKWEKKIPREIRREIFSGRPTRGKRSEVLWKISNTLINIGVPIEEAISIVRSSPWNKFAGRRDELNQLKREFEKIISDRLQSPQIEKPSDYKYLNVNLNDVEDTPIDWLWYPYLARGELTILEGDPGVGKSYCMQMIAKALCDGDKLPTADKRKIMKVKDKIAYFDVENSGPITKSRLKANGLKCPENYLFEEEPFSVDDDEAWDEVMEAIEREKPALVVFDTMNTYIGNIDTNNAAQAQQAFGPFRDIARTFGCAVCVIRHWTKGGKDKAVIYRGQGSIAFTGLARVVMAAIEHPEEEGWNLLAITKINVARKPAPLSYQIRSAPTLSDPDRSKFMWGNYESLDFDRAVAEGKSENRTEVGEEAESIVVEALQQGGWVEKKEIIEKAETRSISKRTVERAIKRMKDEGVIASQMKTKRMHYRQVAGS